MANNDTLIALAGMFQAGYLVRQVAREGRVDSDPFRSSIQSILKTDVETTEEVYGGIDGVRCGLTVLASLYEPEFKIRDLEISQYVLSIVHLEKKLRKHPALLNEISAGITRAQNQSKMYEATHENVLANLASTYADTISTMQPRIVVNGEQGYLTQPDNANKVRALLLALMRSAFLWQQKGGARWQLIFSRGKILKQAQHLLNEIQ